MLYLIHIVKENMQLIFFMVNVVKNSNFCTISLITKFRMIVLVICMRRQLFKVKVSLSLLFLLLELMKLCCYLLILMTTLFFLILLKNFLPKIIINNFKIILFPLTIMKQCSYRSIIVFLTN